MEVEDKYDFLTVGSMGHVSSIALGIAANKPDKKIWCIDGDGAALMHMGSMAVIGANSPKNLIHILINNEAHETVGGMPTVASKVDIPETDRKKRWGIISDYSIFLEDLDTVKKKLITLYPNVPLILYGHSMGGNIAANYLIKKGQEGFKCAVLETPWLRLFKPKAPPLVVLAKVLGKINYKWTTKSGIDLKAISRDEQRVQEIRNDKLYHDRISFRMFSGIDTAGKFAIQNAASLSIPVFLICAEMDRIVSPNAIKMFKEHAGDNVILKIYKEAYHSVHNDLQKEEYFEDVISFLDSSC